MLINFSFIQKAFLIKKNHKINFKEELVGSSSKCKIFIIIYVIKLFGFILNLFQVRFFFLRFVVRCKSNFRGQES